MSTSTPPPNRLPVLTEVVSVEPPSAASSLSASSPHDPSPFAPTQPQTLSQPQIVLDEDAVVQRVLFDLHRQIDLMFEQRLRESLSPALARITDMLVREVRGELGATLREMVERAVALELSRHRRG